METTTVMQIRSDVASKSKFSGLGWIVLIVTLLLSSPLLYFCFELALGNVDLFSVNGAK
jgi:hypothetical protein